jgi:hypothetical protein
VNLSFALGDKLSEGLYFVKVKNLDTQCEQTSSVTMENDPMEVSLALTVLQDRWICDTDGHIQMNSFMADGAGALATDFDLSWRKADPSGAVLTDGTDPIDGIDLIGGNAATEYDDMDANRYYAIGIKNAGPGMGCATPVAFADLADISQQPALAFITTPDQSCNQTADFDGSIQLTATNTAVGMNPNAMPGAGYEIVWTGKPATATIDNPSPETSASIVNLSFALGDKLSEGAYSVKVKNLDTQCEQTATVTMINKPMVVTLAVQKNRDRVVCYTDGELQITAPIGVPGEFAYEWRKGEPDGALLQDNTSTDIGGLLLTGGDGAGLYSAMDEAIYYAQAERTMGPGMGCRSEAKAIQLLDNSENPDLAVAVKNDESCDEDNFDGEITITASNTIA